MADTSGVVVNDLLCFLQNKVHYVPVDTLVEVVVGGFDAGQNSRKQRNNCLRPLLHVVN